MSPCTPRTDPDGPNSGIRLPPRVPDGKALIGPWMENAGFRQPPVGERSDPVPGRTVALTAPTKRTQPDGRDMGSEGSQGSEDGGHSVVCKEPANHAAEPAALLVDRCMPAAHQPVLDRPQLGVRPIAPRLPFDQETTAPAAPADVGEAEEVEGRRFAKPACSPVRRREAAELDEPRLLRMERQPERRHPLPHVRQEPRSLGLVLETGDDVVGIAHEDDVPLGMALPPLLCPQSEGAR